MRPNDISPKMRSFFFITFLLTVLSGSAQKTFSEGTIVFDLLNMVDGKKVDTLANYIQMIKAVHYRADLISDIGRTSTIFDTREGYGAVIRDFGSQKMITPIDRGNWREIHNKYSGLTYIITEDTAKVLGYTCQKATALHTDSSTIEVFFTRSIVPDNADMFAQLGNLPGLTLSFSATSGGTTIMYRVKSLSFDPVQIQKFEIPTTGYRVVTYEESKKR